MRRSKGCSHGVRGVRKAKSTDAADPQKDRVYAWEDEWVDWNLNNISLAECRALIRNACALYKVPAPTVVQHGNGFSWSMPSRLRISVQGKGARGSGGKNRATAMHEAAHHIAWHRFGEKIQDHGPTFLTIYLGLLFRAGVAPAAALKATAREHGLKWARTHSLQKRLDRPLGARSSSSAAGRRHWQRCQRFRGTIPKS